MRIFCMSDIHGCLPEFEAALGLVLEHLDEPDTMLLLLGDYVHGGDFSYQVLDRIMSLQYEYGEDKVMALLGNHEEFVLRGDPIARMGRNYLDYPEPDDGKDDIYIQWMEDLPRYYVEGRTIFVHAGIDEEAGELWEWGTDDYTFVSKYPAETGSIEGLDMKVVAGHVGTAEIAEDSCFHDIYYDGASHYYIDGSTPVSGYVPVLMVDTEKDEYFRVTESGFRPVEAYIES